MMEDNILAPKYFKNKKPVKVRKPSRPIDGINHRLLREQDAEVVDIEPSDDSAPTRAELEDKAIELGIRFDGRTKNKKLGQLIQERLSAQTGE